MFEKMVGAVGFEPATTDTPCQCATSLRYAPTVIGYINFLRLFVNAQAGHRD